MSRLTSIFFVAPLLLLGHPAAAAATPGDWAHHGADAAATKFAALTQIDPANFDRLRIIWRWPTADLRLPEDVHLRDRIRSTPIVVDGILYTITALNQVSALDAATGEELWTFDPGTWQVEHWYLGVARGVSYWTDGAGTQRILFGTSTAYLYSLDAATGEPDPLFGDGGRIDLVAGLGREVERGHYAFVSPPVICDGVVVAGSALVDHRVQRQEQLPRLQPPGDVRGFDVRTGELVWTFHAIPHDGEFGAETWPPGAWREHGGANVWSMMTADPELGYIYLPFSTPDNDFYGGRRPGDGLFGDSVVCLEARTGRRVWHQQLIHHGLWDYDTPAAPVLADVVVDGVPRKVVAQVTKQAFCYVFDRVTGEPIWPIVERPVPQSAVPGEATSPTQPFPTKPPAFDRQGLTRDDLIDFTPELRAAAERIVAGYSYGPLYTPPDAARPVIVSPGLLGGADWAGAAFDQQRGLLYVHSKTQPGSVFLAQPQTGASKGYHRYFGEERDLRGPRHLPITKPPYGRITAVDLHNGTHRWVAVTGRGPKDHPALRHLDLPDLGWPSRNFVIATPTLVLATSEGPIGRGDYWRQPEKFLKAYDPQTGRLLGRTPLPQHAYGGLATYLAGGRQYVVVTVGYAKDAELVALALPRPGEQLPPQLVERRDAEHPQFYAAVALIDAGELESLGALLRREPGLLAARGYLDSAYADGALGGGTLLHAAANNPTRAHGIPGVMASAELLLSRGMDVNAVTAQGFSALSLVVSSQQLRRQGARADMVTALVAAGADPLQQDGYAVEQALISRDQQLLPLLPVDPRGDLRYAAALGDLEALEGFFDASGALVAAPMHPWAPATPAAAPPAQFAIDMALTYASQWGQLDAARWLLDKGAEINARPPGFFFPGDRGSSALHKAAYCGHVEMARWLLENGADPTLRELQWNDLPSDWVADGSAWEQELEELLKAAEAAWAESNP